MSSISQLRAGKRDLYEYPVFGDMGTFDGVIDIGDVPTRLSDGLATKGWKKIVVHVAAEGGNQECTLEPLTWQGWDHDGDTDEGVYVPFGAGDLVVGAADNGRRSFLMNTYGLVVWFRPKSVDCGSFRVTVSGVEKLTDDVS